MQFIKNALCFIITSLILSGCSPFGNSSLIESIGNQISDVFSNAPAPVKSAPSGQIIGNIAGYRMKLGVSSVSAKTKTCNSQVCAEILVSK